MIEYAILTRDDHSIGFYKETRAAALPSQASAGLLSASPVQRILNAPHIPAIGVNSIPNVSLGLSNADGAISALLQKFQAIGSTLDCYDSSDELVFSGTVDRIEVGSVVAISAISFIGNAALDIRTTADWGEYVNIEAIPVMIGDLSNARCKTIPYDSAGFDHCASDGSALITAAYVDDAAVAFEPLTIRDKADKGITIVRLGAPLPEGSVLTVSGRGIADETTGFLLENPADIIYYLVVKLAKQSIQRSTLDSLRAICAREGVRVAYQIIDAGIGLAALINELAGACGFAWTYGVYDLFPRSSEASALYDYTRDDFVANSDRWTANDSDYYNVVRLNYGYHPGLSDFARALELKAKSDRFPVDRTLIIESKWLQNDAAAYAFAARMLRYVSRETYQGALTAKTRAEQIALIGRMYSIDIDRLPIAGSPAFYMFGETTGAADRTINAILFNPRTYQQVLTLKADRLAARSAGGVEFSNRDGVVEVTIVDNDGRPSPGSLASLDGGQARKADNRGVVTFAGVQSGTHTLRWIVEGFEAVEVQIEV